MTLMILLAISRRWIRSGRAVGAPSVGDGKTMIVNT
jgi:hypothetical protein